MKTQCTIFVLIAWLVLTGCQPDQEIVAAGHGTISFQVNALIPKAGRTSTPTDLIISLEDRDGKSIYSGRRLALISFGDHYITEGIELPVKEYHLTSFLVLSNNKVLYTTPRKGSEKASLITQALPVILHVDDKKTTQIIPQVIEVASGDQSEQFGYVSFGFDVIDGSPEEDQEWMNIRVKFEPTVGGVYYPHVDAPFTVVAFDERGVEKWRKVFDYSGPVVNDLKIKSGFHRYSVEVKQWGISNKQIFTGENLWAGRIREGVAPLTYVFAGSVNAKKLSSSISYIDIAVDGVHTQVPETKTEYHYDSFGKLETMTIYTWISDASRYEMTMYRDFTYSNSRVSKINTYVTGSDQPYSIDTYTYNAEGNPVSIENRSLASGITTNVDLNYQYTNRVIEATYQLSNGTGFTYTFENDYGNIMSDRTSRSSELCSQGNYTYDKGVNPLRHIGYVDYLLRNFSSGNKLTEQITYSGCAYPSLIPDHYTYTYDNDGYPTLAVTYYKGRTATMQTRFFY